MSSSFESFFTPDTISQLGGPKAFMRGLEYAGKKLINIVAILETEISAKVQGTQIYEVKFWIQDGEFRHSCTCPASEDGSFCKHCVALGMAVWFKNRKPDDKKLPSGIADLRSFLSNQDKSTLVEIIVELALNHPKEQEHLLLKASLGDSKSVDIDSFKELINKTICPGRYVSRNTIYEYYRNIDYLIERIKELLNSSPDKVVILTEYFLELLEVQLGHTDASDGGMNSVLDELLSLHHKACLKTPLDVVSLAKRFFIFGMKSNWEIFTNAIPDYADVFGKKGIEAYRDMAEKKWAQVPAQKPGDKLPLQGSSHRDKITCIMENLAKYEGNIEKLVAIKSKRLSNPYDFLKIAELYFNAKQYDDALKWAEEGIKAFPGQQDYRLNEFLANEYFRRNRSIEAMELIWNNFANSQKLENYIKLKDYSDKVQQWPEWRQKSQEFLKNRIQQEQKKSGNKYSWGNSFSLSNELVRIFLWEKDIEQAWNTAKEFDCSDGLWLELAGHREKEHPEDAIPIYQKRVEQLIEEKNNDSYHMAVEIAQKIKKLMASNGMREKFEQYITDLQARHKSKRNFIKYLNK